MLLLAENISIKWKIFLPHSAKFRFVHFAYVSLARRLKNRSSAVIGQFD